MGSRYTYQATDDAMGDYMLAFCAQRVGESAMFYSELHESRMHGTVIWVSGRMITVEVEPA